MGKKKINRQEVYDKCGGHCGYCGKDITIKQMQVDHIRWLIRCDMNEVLSIEQGSFEYPWTEEEFICCLRIRNCIGTVATIDKKIVGFMIYELHKSMLRILNFAVAPEARRNGIGRQMVQRLVDKLFQQRRTHLIAEIRETNLFGQLFFSACGFNAVDVLRNHYEDSNEDCYVMRYCLPGVFAGEYKEPTNV